MYAIPSFQYCAGTVHTTAKNLKVSSSSSQSEKNTIIAQKHAYAICAYGKNTALLSTDPFVKKNFWVILTQTAIKSI